VYPRHACRPTEGDTLYHFRKFVYYTDAFVIGYFLSAAAVTWYTIPWSLAEYSKNLCMAVSRTFTPAFADRSVDGVEGLTTLYDSGTRLMLIVSNLLCVGVLVLGDDFIAIWMGEKYRELCAPVMYVMFISLMFQTPQLISESLLQGVGRVKWLAAVT
jgi:O-antigen/teichoic acid export membrane protein